MISIRYSTYLLPLLLLLLLVTCTDDPTEPVHEFEPFPVGVVVSYSTAGETPVSGPYSPLSGASYMTTGSNGVVYELSIAPGALLSEITITVTPFSEIAMYTEMSNGFLGEPDISECLVGALFEPAGIEFDSTAALTITFPYGFECEVGDTLRIVGIDSSLTFFEIMGTEIDEFNSTLSCTLTHFSGYGTYNPNCDCLEAIINAAILYGRQFPSDHAIDILAGHLDFAISFGCDDMADLALEGIHDVFEQLAARTIENANAYPSDAAIQQLISRLEQAKQWGFADIQATLEAGIESVIRSFAAMGKALCNEGEHDDGRAVLTSVLVYVMGGYIDDPDFAAQVQDDLDNCGTANLTLAPDKSMITDYAMHENDTSTFVTFVATLTSYSGEPLEGVSVTLHRKRPGGLYASCGSGTTDESGIAMMRYGYAASPINTEPEGTHYFRATADTEGGTAESGEVSVTFQRTKLNVDYTYNYNESRSESGTTYYAYSDHLGGAWPQDYSGRFDNDGSGTFEPFLFEGDNLLGGHGSMQISVFLSQ